jgi:hypothetical protein
MGVDNRESFWATYPPYTLGAEGTLDEGAALPGFSCKIAELFA